MGLYSTEMGDHLGIIYFSILLILLNSLISLSELHKTPIISNTNGLILQITIPSSKTSYWCRIMKLEPQQQKKHIIMVCSSVRVYHSNYSLCASW